MDRRDFVIAGSVAAAVASVRWLHSGGLFGGASEIASGSSALALGTLDHDVFGAIVRAVLPTDDPRFAAIGAATVTARVNKLFGLDRDATAAQNLALFNDLRQFASPLPVVMTAEVAVYPADESERNIAAPFAARLARDVKRYRTFSDKAPPGAQLFTELSLADQRAYLMLWAHSALGMRRRFYQSMKTLVMVATYSMDAVWPLIGYAGPLLHVPAP